MKKIIIAVDEKKSTEALLSTFYTIVSPPEEIILLHVEKLEGPSTMIDMLGDAELSTLKQMVNETEHKAALDQKAEKILDYYKKEFENAARSVKTVIRAGRPADEILKLAGEERAELIMMGCSRKKGFKGLISGSVARDVKKAANIPVLIARRPFACDESYTWKDAYMAITVTAAIMIAMFLCGLLLHRAPLH